MSSGTLMVLDKKYFFLNFEKKNIKIFDPKWPQMTFKSVLIENLIHFDHKKIGFQKINFWTLTSSDLRWPQMTENFDSLENKTRQKLHTQNFFDFRV